MTKESTGRSLFRHEFLKSRNEESLGSIRLSQPASLLLVVTVAIISISALILFVFFGTITRKSRVAGITVPVQGSIGISSNNTGVLNKIHVSEGEYVTIGQKLFEISTERQNGSGEISTLISQQIINRKQTLDSELRLKNSLEIERKIILNKKLANLDAEAEQLQVDILLLNRRRSLAQENINKFTSLQKSGFISEFQTQQKQEELIDIDSRISNVLRTKLQVQANSIAIKSEMSLVLSSLEVDRMQLERSIASIKQEEAENMARKSNIIVASKSGIVATLAVQSGQSVNVGQILGTLIPKNNEEKESLLEVHLYSPSRTAGFVAKNQVVLIRYQAYPYQKFGLQRGIVRDVSTTPFPPNELPQNLSSTIIGNIQKNTPEINSGEGLYRIRVKLDRQNIDTYEKHKNLKPGMTLEADIIQDKRKIWEFIFEPLLAIAKTY